MDNVATALPPELPVFDSPDPAVVLEQLRGSSMLADGQVCVVALTAIRTRLGARWPERRDMVGAYAEQRLRRQIGARGFFFRTSETEFLVVQPALERLAGQVNCFNALRDILAHFLGEALTTDIVIQEVREIDGPIISARRLDVAVLEAADQAQRATRAPSPPEPAPVTSPNRWTPFTARDGRQLRASCLLEPVVQLKTYGPIGFRMRQRVLQMPGDIPLSAVEQSRLAQVDIERIDFATLARGLNRLQDQAASARQPSLILPVSFSTLSSQRGRATLAEFFRAAQANVQRGLICEVSDIEGVPPSALLAATSLIRPYCLFVVGRLRGTPVQPLDALKGAGLQGLAIECPEQAMTENDYVAFVRMTVAMTRPASKTLMLLGVGSARMSAIASLYGVTHASIAAGGATLQAED
ncbi:MAG TPA: hypothetical protein VGL58_15365 [Caulobacteraceae bacterium]|jgi:hypothetical protein